MAMAMGMMGSASGSPSASSLNGFLGRRKPGKNSGGGGRGGVKCSAVGVGGLRDQYRMLRLQPGASETEVKKAFRQLALQYHPDVCKGTNCGVQFHQINQAYDMIINSFRKSEGQEQWDSVEDVDSDDEDALRGMYDSNWDMWEEWMGWEGAGIRDYSSHINPYI